MSILRTRGLNLNQAENIINNVFYDKRKESSVTVISGQRYGGYLWLDCRCNECGKMYENPIRYTNLKNGKFICHNCHPDREFAFCNIGDSQPYRFNILQQNNTSGYVGVDYVKKEKKWRARLNYNKKCYNLGLFNTAEEAHYTREQKRQELGLVNMNKFTKENSIE